MLLFVRQMSQYVTVDKEDHDSLNEELKRKRFGGYPAGVVVYSIQGPFFFCAVEKLEHAFAVTHSDPKVIIFRLKNVPFIDMTGLQTFSEIIENFINVMCRCICAKLTLN